MSKLTKEAQRSSFLQLLSGLQDRDYYGTVTLKMQSGNIVLVERNEQTKLEEVNDGNARQDPEAQGP